MIVLATKHKGNDMLERGYLKGFFDDNDKTAKMWRQLIEYVHPEGEKALEKYRKSERERAFGVSKGAAEPIVKHDLASATKLSLWIKIFSEAAASILGTTPHDLLTILQLEDTDRHLQPWNHNSDDPLGINWYLIEETLKKSKYTEKKLGRKITDEDLAKLREVAEVVAKLVDAWGPDNVDYATIWLARGKKVDDLKEFIERFAKDPEKTLQYLEELRQVLHKYIKPKGLVARYQKVESSPLLEIQRELQSLKEENKKTPKGNGRAEKGTQRT